MAGFSAPELLTVIFRSDFCAGRPARKRCVARVFASTPVRPLSETVSTGSMDKALQSAFHASLRPSAAGIMLPLMSKELSATSSEKCRCSVVVMMLSAGTL